MGIPGSNSERTLQLSLPIGQTLVLAMTLLGFLLASCEVLVRTQVFQAHVVANRRGGRHRQFELQLGRLETIVARDGPIDCIVLGNSMVWLGFDPAAFAQAYRRQTGQDIRCFNFGVDGMPTVSAGALASILVDSYQPSLLIYGTSAQDYAIDQESEEATVLLEMPWLQYRLGQFSIQGWFCDHSRLYQYWETLGHLLRLEKRYLMLTGFYASSLENYGFRPENGIRTLVNSPPNPQSEETPVQYLFGLLSHYRVQPENLSGLEQVAALNRSGAQVVVVEMPVPPTYLHFLGEGRLDYQRYIEQVDSVAETKGVPFWQTTQLGSITDDGWWDYSHLNREGARIFSEWLGEEVGSAVVRGELENPVAKH